MKTTLYIPQHLIGDQKICEAVGDCQLPIAERFDRATPLQSSTPTD